MMALVVHGSIDYGSEKPGFCGSQGSEFKGETPTLVRQLTQVSFTESCLHEPRVEISAFRSRGPLACGPGQSPIFILKYSRS